MIMFYLAYASRWGDFFTDFDPTNIWDWVMIPVQLLLALVGILIYSVVMSAGKKNNPANDQSDADDSQ